VANKVTHVINCAGKQVGNHWESIGVVYLTFFWMDSENQVLFDSQDKTTRQIFEFIESAAKKSESILVHSVRGQSRAASVLACYMMRKYRWSMIKTLEFLNSRRPELEIKASFIQQL
jgi:protein-tyrosine phosphatase